MYMLTIEKLEKDLDAGSLKSIYLFYGEELFLLESSVKKIKKLFGECIKGINYITIDDTNLNELLSNIETPAFGYDKKLIIIKNTGLLKKDGKRKNIELTNQREKINSYIQENISSINEHIIMVVLEEDVNTKLELYKTIEKIGCVCKFDYQKPAQLIGKLKNICKAYKVTVENSILQYLIECCGTNMQDLINEIRKLIEYVGENGTINREDIDKLTTRNIESIIFDLTDNLGRKRTKEALEVLNNLIYTKEPLQKILITLYNHFKKIYFTKLAIQYNKDIESSLDLKANQMFLVNKYKAQANFFNVEELNILLQKLRDLDYQYKIGEIDLQIGLETILCTCCS